MKKLLLASTLLLATTTVAAADMALRLQEDGTLTQDFFSAPGQTSFSGPANFVFGDFVISNITGAITPSTTAPVILSANTLDLQSTATGSHVLDVFVTGTGFTSPTGLAQDFSGFTDVSLSAGWFSILATLVDTANGNFTGGLVGGNSNTGDGISAFSSNSTTFTDFGSGPFSATAHFEFVTNGPGQANTGIQFAVVPGPIVGAGLPGLIAGCIGLFGWVRNRRKVVVS